MRAAVAAIPLTLLTGTSTQAQSRLAILQAAERHASTLVLNGLDLLDQILEGDVIENTEIVTN
jgi:hypothetical protein